MSNAINLSDELYKKLEEKVAASEEFNSVDDYAAYVLEEVMKKQTEKAAINSARKRKKKLKKD